MQMHFGGYARQVREQCRQANRRYSVRQTARRIGVEPAYLSKVERGEVSPPSEPTIRRLAAELGEDVDIFLAAAGQISSDIRDIIVRRPLLFTELIRRLSDLADSDLAVLVERVRNGK
ncbi:MAG: helix-turn-helix transcriptional regulator [Candidatus Competibacter sp.]|nr:helix-turn-helix transcriptional regulator [Candidatus Competibacter sp.]MDG4584519.1 helix-turn-helix transcriptional regulator [Candidatus Competibacter sp.]